MTAKNIRSNSLYTSSEKFLNFIKPVAVTALILIVNFSISGCVSTKVNIYHAAGEKEICNGDKYKLGVVAVIPEHVWRTDQKEPEVRNEMALQEIKNAFVNFPCGDITSPGGVRAFSNWSNQPEKDLLEKLNNEGVNTVILIRVEELSPRLFVTFSLPFLWAGASEADFRIRALSVDTGKVITDVRISRVKGGPFNIRPADWARYELNLALLDVIGKAQD